MIGCSVDWGVMHVGVDGQRAGELADGRRWGLVDGTRFAWAVGFVVVWLLVRGVTWLLYVVGVGVGVFDRRSYR